MWTPLYADIAVVSAAALTTLEGQGRTDEAAALRTALALNLALNTGWSVLFWRVRRPWLSTAWCGVLAAQGLYLARRLRSVDPVAARRARAVPRLVPFATALNASIARRATPVTDRAQVNSWTSKV